MFMGTACTGEVINRMVEVLTVDVAEETSTLIWLHLSCNVVAL